MTEVHDYDGRRFIAVSGAVGVLGLLATLLLALVDPTVALVSYLAAFAYWVGIAIGALILLMAFYAANARWMVVMRRVLEAMASTPLLFAVLFVPIAAGAPRLFRWAGPHPYFGEGPAEMLRVKARWLSIGQFSGRAALYFAIWIGVSQVLFAWSLEQDESGAIGLTVRLRRVAAGALPLLALSITFAAFDWLMSLSPGWASTIFGAYYWAGGFVSAIALLIVLTVAAEARGVLHGLVRGPHYHSLGKLLLAFVCFWAYMAFSQLLLIWIANLPVEVVWYRARTQGGWGFLAAALVIGHFLFPFAVLLSKGVKLLPKALSAVALWILAVHYVDVYWVVMPNFYPSFSPHVSDLTSFVGVGGAAFAFGAYRLRGRKVVPARDPYIGDSVRYSPP